MGQTLKDKVAVVTGSGRGLGKSMAVLLAEEGAKVVINDVGGAKDGGGTSSTPAEETVNEIKGKGGTAVANYDSVATTDGGTNIIKTALDNFGRIDILVNNAGILRDTMFHKMEPDVWDAVIKVHLYGHYNCTRPAMIHMREQKSGRIINITSLAALGNAGQGNYSAAKAGILGLTRTLAKEGSRNNITCNALIPFAPTRLSWTPDIEESWTKAADAGDETIKGYLELMKATSPDDLAPMVAYLASDAAANITGRTIYVQGGMIQLFSDPTPVKTIKKPERWTIEELVESMPKLFEK